MPHSASPVSLICGGTTADQAQPTLRQFTFLRARDAERDGLCERVLVAIGAIGNVDARRVISANVVRLDVVVGGGWLRMHGNVTGVSKGPHSSATPFQA